MESPNKTPRFDQEYPMSLEIFSLRRALYGRNDEENDCAVSRQPKSTVVRINLEHNSLARHAGTERLVGGLRRLVIDLGSVVKVTQPIDGGSTFSADAARCVLHRTPPQLSIALY